MSTDNPEGATRIIERPGQDPVLVVRRATLTVTRGPDKGRAVELDEGRPLTVGSDGALCDLALTDPAISSRHFSIEPDSQGFLLRDRRAPTAPSWTATVSRRSTCPSGRAIEAGQSRLEFAALEGEVELPLSNHTRLRAAAGPQRRHAAGLRHLRAGRRHRHHVLIEGESRHRQGAGGARPARRLVPPGRGLFVAVDCGALPADAHRERALRSRQGGLHRRHGGQGRAVRGGRRRHPVPRRDRRAAAGPAAQAAARAGDAQRAPGGGDAHPRPSTCGCWPPPTATSTTRWPRALPRGPLLPALGDPRAHCRRCASAARRSPAWWPTSLTRWATIPPSSPIPDSILELLPDYRWPGNVRELRNVVERLVLLPGMQPDFYLDPSGAAEPGEKAATPRARGHSPPGPALPRGQAAVDRALRARVPRAALPRARATSRSWPGSRALPAVLPPPAQAPRAGVLGGRARAGRGAGAGGLPARPPHRRGRHGRGLRGAPGRQEAEGSVVLKVLLPQFAADPELIEMFEDEARLARSLDHPNLVRVLEPGAARGKRFIVMEHVDGPTLSQLLAARARARRPAAPGPGAVPRPVSCSGRWTTCTG